MCCLVAVQVQYAFLAGLGVVILLIPANRWLAVRIQAASKEMMAAKDRWARCEPSFEDFAWLSVAKGHIEITTESHAGVEAVPASGVEWAGTLQRHCNNAVMTESPPTSLFASVVKQSPSLEGRGRLACRRVRVMVELLRGIRQVKACAWEAFFSQRVR